MTPPKERGVLRSALGNRQLRRVQIAFAFFNGAEWGGWLCFLVYAYSLGGTNAACAMSLVQLIPAAILAPWLGSLSDRYRPGRVLLGGYSVMAVAMAAAAAAMALDAPAVVVYLLAAIGTLGVTLPRPAQASLLPAIVRTPSELTAANVFAGWAETGAVLVAPVLVGVLLGVGGSSLALAAMAGFSVIAALAVATLPGPEPLEAEADAASTVKQGLAAIKERPAVRLLVGVLGSQYLLIGALDLLIVGLAIDVLGMGESGTGYLNSAVGFGGLLAGAVTATLVGRRRLAPPLLAGILGAGVSLVLLGLWTTVPSAFLFIGLAGFGRTVFDVTGRTLLQRTAPSGVIAGVFGMLECLMNVGLAAGALLVPILIGLAGAEAAIAGAGAVFVVIAAALGRRLMRADEDADMPQVEIQLLRSIPIFAPLPAPALEGVARSLEPLSVPAGTLLIREGEPGDRYYAIADGELRVTRDDREIALRRRGEGVGEIALIRRIPRTATVTAVTDAQLYSLEEEPFLIALTGHAAAAAAADRTVTERSEEV